MGLWGGHRKGEADDHIATMLGSETLTVLRPVTSLEIEQYEPVGPCYLQGLTFGESFLGPLPEGMQPVAHYEDEKGTAAHFEFFDTMSDESSSQDPRLDAFLDPDQAWPWQTDGDRGPAIRRT